MKEVFAGFVFLFLHPGVGTYVHIQYFQLHVLYARPADFGLMLGRLWYGVWHSWRLRLV